MKIEFNSTARGEGQVFDLSLPELAAMPSRAFRQPGESPEISGDPDIRSLHCSVLTDGVAARLYRQAKGSAQNVQTLDGHRSPGSGSQPGLRLGVEGRGLRCPPPHFRPAPRPPPPDSSRQPLLRKLNTTSPGPPGPRT